MIIQAAEDVGWARVCLKLMMCVFFFARQKIALQFSFIYIFGVYVSFILKERVSFKHPGRLRIAVAQKRTADLQKPELLEYSTCIWKLA